MWIGGNFRAFIRWRYRSPCGVWLGAQKKRGGESAAFRIVSGRDTFLERPAERVLLFGLVLQRLDCSLQQGLAGFDSFGFAQLAAFVFDSDPAFIS